MRELFGRAWISQVIGLDERPGDLVGYWETDEPQPRVLEDGLRWSSPEPALEWARQRASVVMIRMAHTDYFSAGRDQPSWQRHAPRWRGEASGETTSFAANEQQIPENRNL